MRAGRKPSALTLAAGILVALLSFVSAAAAQPRDIEPAVKATYLIRFAAFTEWPAASFQDASAPIVICIASDTRLADLAERAATGERVGARSLVVRRYSEASGGAGCHILYAGGAATQMLEGVRGQPVLTVTDFRRGRARGMIHFALENGRVRFHVDRDAADAAGLNLNARLLSVALSVRSRRGS